MRILLTGVSGFVGQNLARHLLACGDEVAGTYSGLAPELAGVELLEADLRQPRALEQTVARLDPEAIVHLAGLSHVGASWRHLSEYFKVNVLGTENLLRAAAGRPVAIASSAEVYGNVPEAEQPLAEDRVPGPESPYALTKAAAERLAAASGAVIVRCFNLLGRGQSSRFALPSFARQLARIARGEAPPVLEVGNLEARRDFLHVDEAAVAYRLLLERGSPGGIYNVGSGEARSIREVLELLFEVSGTEARIEVDPGLLRPVDLPLLRADTSRLRTFGWAPRRSLEDALRDLWDDARRRVAAAE